MKITFRYRTEWSDRSEISPQSWGQLPDAIILPDGERINDLAEPCDLPASSSGYVQIHPNVRIRITPWGDDGSRRHGRAGATMEILAPKTSRFIFNNYCSFCGQPSGEQELPGLRYDERTPEIAHTECQAQHDEEERMVREEYEADERRQEALWARLTA